MRKYISIFSLVLQYNNCATGGILMLLSYYYKVDHYEERIEWKLKKEEKPITNLVNL